MSRKNNCPCFFGESFIITEYLSGIEQSGSIWALIEAEQISGTVFANLILGANY